LTTTSSQQARIVPNRQQIEQVRKLFDRVPTLSYDWRSAAGQAFLTHVAALVSIGVPLSWIAEPLGLDPQRLYHALTRRQRSAA
jgi:hypothetical protein